MYDVLYLDRKGSLRVVGSKLDRESAIAIARNEAAQQRVGRMFLAGSELPADGCAVLIVDCASQIAHAA